MEPAEMIKRPPIIDIEASGFGVDSYPIEVGYVHSDGERFCRLIAPAKEWHFWDKQAETVHHINRQRLIEHGHPLHEVAWQLNQALAGQTLFSDGWVVDKPWLNTLFYYAGLPMQFTVSPLELILSEAQMTIWTDVKTDVISDLNLTRHRASHDALIIQETYHRTQKMTAVSNN